MSSTWVALIRGINLGRSKRLAMTDLRALLEELGYADVRTVITSGNALFSAPRKRAAQLEREVAARLASDLGLDVKVLVRSGGELAAVIEGNPYGDPPVKELHVAFLATEPAADKKASIDPSAFAPDEFRFGDRVVYLRLPNGIAGSRLPDWEQVLGVAVTVRTWNTVLRLHERAGA